jgi:hypothetical protein
MRESSTLPPLILLPGHFYSPIPSIEDIERAITGAPASYSGIDLREDQQPALLEKLSRYYAEIPFPAEKNERFRFAFHNPSYSWGDAIILFCMFSVGLAVVDRSAPIRSGSPSRQLHHREHHGQSDLKLCNSIESTASTQLRVFSSCCDDATTAVSHHLNLAWRWQINLTKFYSSNM